MPKAGDYWQAGYDWVMQERAPRRAARDGEGRAIP
jgi:hypothetical protein